MANAIVLDQWKSLVNSLILNNCSIDMDLYTDTGIKWSHNFDPSTLTAPGWSGYATTATSSWVKNVIDGTFDEVCTASPITWTNTDPMNNFTITCFVYSDSVTSTYMGGQNLDVPVTLSPGMSLVLTPTFQSNSQF